MPEKIRSPIVSLLGHVDHGKTTLLDYVRGTTIAKGEPGLITQHISASYVPTDIVKKLCGKLLKKLGIELKIPGLLWIDSPGHEAFTTLRKRGGAVADIAILIIDVNKGFQPQTDESLNFLKQFKTPFIVAATKIDRLLGWQPVKNACFLETIKNQPDRTQNELEEKIYKIIGELISKGFDADRYDRVSDFTKKITIVPVSGITGEGIPDLIMILSGIAQKYLAEKLELKQEGKGTILEVKEFKGLGTTIDVILYDGKIRKTDYIVIGKTKKDVIITKVRALLRPKPLKELRTGKDFIPIDSVSAAAGIKISAPNLEEVIPGSPLRAVKHEKELENAKEEVIKEVEEVEIQTEREGAILKADTLGSLEALIKSLQELLPVRKAKVGGVTKSDIIEVKNFKDPMIFAFCVEVKPEIMKIAEDNKIKIFQSDVIYSLIDAFQEYEEEKKKTAETKILESTTKPGKVRILPGCVFRQKKPAIFGVEVIAGTIKTKYRLKKDNKDLGEIKEMQSRGETVSEAKIGDKVAISMPDVTTDKDVKEGDTLETRLTGRDIENLKKIRKKLRIDEIELLEEKESE